MEIVPQDVVAAACEKGVGASSQMSVIVEGGAYEGYVVIDSIVEGISSGGVRIAHDLPLEEVRALAREMTFKYALFHLPQGGAKAGLRLSGQLDAQERMAALSDFGRRLAPLIRNGIYNPGMDMNCGPKELRAIYRGAGIELGQITDTSWFTAMSVFQCLESCASTLDINDRPVSLAIEGFGRVARHLAARLDPRRFRIAAVATIEGAAGGLERLDPADLARAKDAHGDALVHELAGEPLDREALLALDVDILLPSSRTWVIHPELAHRMRASAIVPVSNAPYGEGTVDILHAKGTHCLPGYLSNVGGVLASSLHDLGVTSEKIEELFRTEYRSIVNGILRLADQRQKPTTEISASLAMAHMAKRPPYRTRSLSQKIYKRFLQPRMPRGLHARAAEKIFVERCSNVRAEIERMDRES